MAANKFFGNKKDPVESDDIDESPNLTDVNSGPASIDEDGEANTDEDGKADTEEDDSTTVHGLAVKTSHLAGMATVQTEIIATIHGPTGLTSKRLVVPGAITTKRLAALLDGVASW